MATVKLIQGNLGRNAGRSGPQGAGLGKCRGGGWEEQFPFVKTQNRKMPSKKLIVGDVAGIRRLHEVKRSADR